MIPTVFSPLSLWRAGATLGSTGILLATYGAHALKNTVSDPAWIKNWQTATNYQLLHALAILYLSNAHHPATNQSPLLAGTLMTIGTTMFSGVLYLKTLSVKARVSRILAPTVPIGGLLMCAGWAFLWF
ncbi:11179_t:CDS:2 [Ambispora leptoticha]|uniref:11179_t:CDS:1 n=1 Tax=Ambispora leptoticha TaxID=144679 RepID=A0A9N9B8R5_9GLOM|nr:11179_t:CDS:2 [Ambispora leptoticha]